MCEYCDSTYKELYKTKEIEVYLYFSIINEIRISTKPNKFGMFQEQTIININYCPMCGRRLGENV